jgi:hypothetical protein
MSDEIKEESDIDNLINQLRTNNSIAVSNTKEVEPLKKEEVEKFVIEKAGELVRESLDLLREIKINSIAASTTDPEQIAAIASLTSATTSSIETLSKIIISDKKNDTVIKAKQIEIEGRKSLAENEPVKLLITREELIKNLLTNVSEKIKPIDVVSTVNDPQQTDQ